jgi:hypothetical protein
VTISLYTNCVVAAGAVWCASYAVTAVKGFADACYKGEKDVTKGIAYPKDEESV